MGVDIHHPGSNAHLAQQVTAPHTMHRRHQVKRTCPRNSPHFPKSLLNPRKLSLLPKASLQTSCHTTASEDHEHWRLNLSHSYTPLCAPQQPLVPLLPGRRVQPQHSSAQAPL